MQNTIGVFCRDYLNSMSNRDGRRYEILSTSLCLFPFDGFQSTKLGITSLCLTQFPAKRILPLSALTDSGEILVFYSLSPKYVERHVQHAGVVSNICSNLFMTAQV